MFNGMDAGAQRIFHSARSMGMGGHKGSIFPSLFDGSPDLLLGELGDTRLGPAGEDGPGVWGATAWIEQAEVRQGSAEVGLKAFTQEG